MTARPIFRDPALQALFDVQGYVIVPFFDAAEVERLLHKVAELYPADVASNAFDEWSYVSSNDTERRADISEFVRPAMAPRIGALLAGAQVWTGTLLQRTAGAGPLLPHQHPPSTTCVTDLNLICWCPLFDSDADSGALQVVPGSHQLLPHIMASTSPAAWRDIAEALPDYPVTLTMRAGEAVLFSESLIHGSAPNKRDRARVAMISLLLPDDSIPALFYDSQVQPDHVDVYRVEDEFSHSDRARGVFPADHVAELFDTIPARRVLLGRLQVDALLAIAPHQSDQDRYRVVADLVGPPPAAIPVPVPVPPTVVPVPGRLRRFAARHLPEGVKARLRAFVS